jgi:hypothetical protein
MSYLKNPLQRGGRWLRQATVLGLGVGLLAGTGLIVTASVASAHSAAPANTTSNGPSRACALVIGRPGHLRVRPQHCRPAMVIALASPVCKGRLLPAPSRTVIARVARPPKALRLAWRGQAKLPVLRIRACASRVLRRIGPVQLRVCGKVRAVRLKLFAAAPRAVRRPARVRLIAPARACSLVPVPAPKH